MTQPYMSIPCSRRELSYVKCVRESQRQHRSGSSIAAAAASRHHGGSTVTSTMIVACLWLKKKEKSIVAEKGFYSTDRLAGQIPQSTPKPVVQVLGYRLLHQYLISRFSISLVAHL